MGTLTTEQILDALEFFKSYPQYEYGDTLHFVINGIAYTHTCREKANGNCKETHREIGRAKEKD